MSHISSCKDYNLINEYTDDRKHAINKKLDDHLQNYLLWSLKEYKRQSCHNHDCLLSK